MDKERQFENRLKQKRMDGQIGRLTEKLTDKTWICDFDVYPTIGELINLPCRLKTQSFANFTNLLLLNF